MHITHISLQITHTWPLNVPSAFLSFSPSLKVKQFRKSSQHSHSVWHGVFMTTDHSESWHGQEAEVDLVGFRRLSVQTMKIHNSPCGQFKPVLSAWVELTLSLPRCYLKMTNKSVRCQILKPFFFFLFCISNWKDFHQNAHCWNSITLVQDGKIHCLQACACTFQPGNFTG